MRGPGSARRSSSPRASTSRCASGAGAPPLAEPGSLRSEVLARLGQFGARIARPGQLDEMGEVEPRLVLVAGLGGGLARAPIAAVPLRVADLRSLVFGQRLGGTAAFQQHVAEQFAGRDQPAGADRMLLALVLDVGGG